jgi:hypothetical protein
MPAPGRPGGASQHREGGARLGKRDTTPFWSGLLGGRVAALVAGPNGRDGHVVIAGSPGLRFGGSARAQISAVASAGGKIGPVTTLPVNGDVVALTGTASTVYVNANQPPGSYAPSHITGYPAPPACR